AVDAEPVPLAGRTVGEVAVPAVRGDLWQVHPGLGPGVVEQAELHPLGHLGEDREVRTRAVVRGAERVGLARPQVHDGQTYPRGPGATFWRPSGSSVARLGTS